MGGGDGVGTILFAVMIIYVFFLLIDLIFYRYIYFESNSVSRGKTFSFF